MNTHDPNDLALLVAYRLGEIKSDKKIQEIRSSSPAMSWLRNYRLIQILAKNSDDSYEGTVIDSQKLIDFWNEILPAKEMLAVEQTLTTDPAQFDEYLAIRLEAIAEVSFSVPEPLDELVKGQILGANKSITHIDIEVAEAQTWIGKLIDFISHAISTNKVGWASGIAVASLMLAFGGSMLIQKSSQQFPPLIIASLEPSEMPLSFRGRKKSVRPTLGENGEIKFAEFDLNQMIINNLVELENNPSPDIVRLLINEINRDITKHNILNTKVGSPGKFRIEDIFFVQVEEKLWTKITDGKANMIRVSASIEETGLLTSRKSEIPMGPRNKTLIYIFSNP